MARTTGSSARRTTRRDPRAEADAEPSVAIDTEGLGVVEEVVVARRDPRAEADPESAAPAAPARTEAPPAAPAVPSVAAVEAAAATERVEEEAKAEPSDAKEPPAPEGPAPAAADEPAPAAQAAEPPVGAAAEPRAVAEDAGPSEQAGPSSMAPRSRSSLYVSGDPRFAEIDPLLGRNAWGDIVERLAPIRDAGELPPGLGLILALAERELAGEGSAAAANAHAIEAMAELLGVSSRSETALILAKRLLRQPPAALRAQPAPPARISVLIIVVVIALGVVAGWFARFGSFRFF
jgi:hypothetical protein